MKLETPGMYIYIDIYTHIYAAARCREACSVTGGFGAG